MSSGDEPQNADPDLWHAGERSMQEMAGVRAAMEKSGEVVLRDFMPAQHRQFFAERQQIFLGVLDGDGWPWATVLEGEVGFLSTPDAQLLTIDAMPLSGDPARAGILDGAPIGGLGIEFATRRRNRVNGVVRYQDGAPGFEIQVSQSFGNCPKYIQARHLVPGSKPAVTPAVPDSSGVQLLSSLSPEHVALIEAADTFFIASRSASPGLTRSEGLDVSHRGGLPGFVAVENERRLAFPDYRGNFFFNTLGNLLSDERCGLLFMDFENGNVLQLAGRGHVLSDEKDRKNWPGAERVITVDVEQAVYAPARLKTRYTFGDYARQFVRPAESGGG